MSKPVFWEGRVTIGGVELPARGTLRETGEPLKLPAFASRGEASFTFVLDPEAAPCSGCGATQGAGHWPACPIASAVVTFFEALFRLHAHRAFRADMARSLHPVCATFELGSRSATPDYDSCARCLWSRRAHTP